ncbi:site-specific integrase [Pseudarthrobacter sp. R1]|uniref:tyrosine-type recombinase/integrase n=1 Tax=Pseudarthrobacter sp. R1 TaxID=2944934 RepID=UPI00210D7072|nr:site-specific integrase [Pseudarthrobacter sp. R1]MCQ6271004.1 site-specific integrase [Pseudarthrobacter sp. R1]
MASVVTRARWDGTTAFSVRWRDYKSGHQHRLTVRSEQEARSLLWYLNHEGRIQKLSPPADYLGKPGLPNVAKLVQEHIDLLVRPSPGTIGTYQRILDLHIRNTIGHIPVDELGHREIMHWVKGLTTEGVAPKSIHNMHGLLSAAMKTAELLEYVSRNPCRGVPLPTVERAEDDAMFLTHAEFSLLMQGMNEQYKTLAQFLVMTGTRFGEATALKVADIDLLSKPPTARINKAWKRDGQSHYYIGPTKTGAGKRTIGLNPALVNLLIPLVASRSGSDLLFTTTDGRRIAHKPFWQHQWVPAVRAAHSRGLTKTPRIHDLRHTHASWLIQDGVISLFAISRRLGHASVRTTEQVYGHLMPQALQDGADATERSIRGFIS